MGLFYLIIKQGTTDSTADCKLALLVVDPVPVVAQTTWSETHSIVRGAGCWAWNTVQVGLHAEQSRWVLASTARGHQITGMQKKLARPGPQLGYNQEKKAYYDQVHNRLQLDRHHLLSTKFFFSSALKVRLSFL